MTKLHNMRYAKRALKKICSQTTHQYTDDPNILRGKNLSSSNSLFEQAAMGIAYLNEHGHIVAANKAFQDLVQYPLDELLQIPVSHLVYPADLINEQALRNELLTGNIKDYSLHQRYIRKNGEPIWVSTHSSCFQEDQDPAIEMVIFTHDITTQKKRELELEEINAIKNKFFMIIGHDLRNPIESIKILTSFLEHESEKNGTDSIREITSLLSDQAEHTQKLLSNLLSWSEAQAKKISFVPKQMNISKIIAEQIAENAIIAHNKKITLQHRMEKEIWIEVDSDMLKTILRNLINNAIKFSYADSNVWISAQERSDDVLITVEDQGKGIHPIIFDRLFRAEFKSSTTGTQNEMGTGLGLLLCKEFVEYHGGKIWAESSINSGSKFLFTLPKHQ